MIRKFLRHFLRQGHLNYGLLSYSWKRYHRTKYTLKEHMNRQLDRIDLNPNNPQHLKKIKYFSGFIALVLIVYLINRDKGLPHMTIEELFQLLKQNQVDQIRVIDFSKHLTMNSQENLQPNQTPQPKLMKKITKLDYNNARKLQVKCKGGDYLIEVMDIDIFYEKFNEIVNARKAMKLDIDVKLYEIIFTSMDQQFRNILKGFLFFLAPLIFPFLLYRSSIGKIFKSKSIGELYGQRPNIYFEDIAGLGNAKLEVSQLVDFLKNPAKYKKIGARVPKGALLTGPPGTGKTMLAKACAGEANVPFFSVSGSQFVQLFAGMGATRVRDLFKNAKKQTPAIIFIDQIDAIGRKRENKFGGGHDQRANTLNQLLVQMDGFGTSTDIIVLAATNRKQMLDSALIRPGRFDRIVDIELPDIKGRQQILQIYLPKLKLSTVQTMKDYSRRIATLTYGFSGADLANLCNEAAILAVRNGKNSVEPIDFQNANDRVLAGLQRSITLSEKEKRRVAYHEAGHAVVSWFSEGAAPLLKITIVPRSKGSLGFAQYLPNQSTLQNKQQLIDQICVILGGRTSEQFFFNEVSNGASDDLMKVRRLARAMVVSFGMSQSFPNYAPVQTEGENIYSESTARKIDEEIIKVIEDCTEETRRLVKKYSEKIKLLAEAVLLKETLGHSEILEILGKRPFQIKENYREYLEHTTGNTVIA